MPRRIFKDPLQARLRAMEKKKSSTTKPGKLTDSFKLDPNRRNEVVQRVKQDPKRFVKSVEPGKRLENYSSEERRVYDAVKEEYFFRDLSQKRPLRSYLGELRESALFGDQNYV